MSRKFSIGEAAITANMTSETLRHYDRVGLVKPSIRDKFTKYRYYTEQDIVRLNTVHALQQMDLSLREIKEVLEYDDLEKIIHFLEQAEKRADEKIAELQNSKAKLILARASYEKKLPDRSSSSHIKEMYVMNFPERLIMLSDAVDTPTLGNLWNYLSGFYDRIDPDQRNMYSFEDLAGIYTENGRSNLFAVCTRHGDSVELKSLPAGPYLCVDCTEDNRELMIDELKRNAKKQYHVEPGFTVQIIVVSGILSWKYQLQIPLFEQ